MVERVTKVCVLDSCPDEGLASASFFYETGFCFLVCLFVVFSASPSGLVDTLMVGEMTERFTTGSVAG